MLERHDNEFVEAENAEGAFINFILNNVTMTNKIPNTVDEDANLEDNPVAVTGITLAAVITVSLIIVCFCKFCLNSRHERLRKEITKKGKKLSELGDAVEGQTQMIAQLREEIKAERERFEGIKESHQSMQFSIMQTQQGLIGKDTVSASGNRAGFFKDPVTVQVETTPLRSVNQAASYGGGLNMIDYKVKEVRNKAEELEQKNASIEEGITTLSLATAQILNEQETLIDQLTQSQVYGKRG